MGKIHYATCGHKIEYGITIQIDEGNIDGYTYGTYCSDCLLQYWVTESVLNTEFNEFMDKAFDYKERTSMYKFLFKLFKKEFDEYDDELE